MNRTAVPPPVTMVLDAADAWLPTRMEAVEERLRRLVEGHGQALSTDAGSTLAAGGKRLRPIKRPSRRPFDEVVHRGRW